MGSQILDCRHPQPAVRYAFDWRRAMIARLWSAKATPSQALAYADHLKNHVLPAMRMVDGYAGAMLLERQADGAVEIIVITRWRSLDAIREFAGADLDEAAVADEAS